MKRIDIIILFLVIHLILFTGRFSFAQSFKSGSEPAGFRGMKWGTELSTLSGMKYHRTSEMGGSLPVDLWDFDRGGPITEIVLEIYLRLKDELKIGGAEFEKIEYGFWKGKFCEVTMTTRGFENWTSLRRKVLGKFGEGIKSNFKSPFVGVEGFDSYVWMGKTAEMELIYMESLQTGKLWIGSTLLREQIIEEVRRGAKGPVKNR